MLYGNEVNYFKPGTEAKVALSDQGKVYTDNPGFTLRVDMFVGVELSVRKAEKAGLKSTYQQKVYYFASAENRARFDQEPGRYVKKP